MIRVTFVLGCHEHRYTQHYENSTVEVVGAQVRMAMKKAYFDMDITGGTVRIYTNKVSAIEVRDVSHEEAILKAQQEGV